MTSIEEDVQRWAERLASPSMGGRGEATHALARLGADAIPIAEAIVVGKNRWGQRHAAQSRRGAVIVLRVLGPAAVRCVKLLTDVLLVDGDDVLRMEAAMALGAIGQSAREAVPALRLLATAAQLDLRMEAAAAIARIESAVA